MRDNQAEILELARELVLDGPPLTRAGCCFHCDQPIMWPEPRQTAGHARYCFWALLARALSIEVIEARN